jgi:hypothetical protein
VGSKQESYNHYVCGLCPSSVIDIYRKQVSETGSVSTFRSGKEVPAFLDSLE